MDALAILSLLLLLWRQARKRPPASEVMTYWKTMLPNWPIPMAILDHMRVTAGEQLPFYYGTHSKRDAKDSDNVKQDGEQLPFYYGAHSKGAAKDYDNVKQADGEQLPFYYGPHSKGVDKYSDSVKQAIADREQLPFYYGAHSKGVAKDGDNVKQDGEQLPFYYGRHNKGVPTDSDSVKQDNGEQLPFYYGAHSRGAAKDWDNVKQADGEQLPFYYGPHSKGVDRDSDKIYCDGEQLPFYYGPHSKGVTKDSDNVKQDGEHLPFYYGPNSKGFAKHNDNLKQADGEQLPFYCGPHSKGVNKDSDRVKHDDEQLPFYYGPHSKGVPKDSDDVKQAHYFPIADGEHLPFYYRPNSKGFAKDSDNFKQDVHRHSAGHIHGGCNFTNVLFLENVLTPGTTVSPCTPPATTSAPFLRRQDADAIPVSMNSFTDIIAMFAPASLAMARAIRTTLHDCEYPNLVEGERQACVTSVESMVEFAASVIGGGTTWGLRALSSSHDVPGEGVVAGTRRYTVLATRRVMTTGSSSEEVSMTCHALAFPYALFYCHSLKPTRVYEVTLRDEDAAPGTAPMRVHAVCHLDTSKFNPEMPFFVERGLKPGDAAVCHFISRDSILWTRVAAATKGNARALAR
ncbi:hypothetical protein ACP4OV_001539 [Aristida adscensionis]